jgi:hypothetical protein
MLGRAALLGNRLLETVTVGLLVYNTIKSTIKSPLSSIFQVLTLVVVGVVLGLGHCDLLLTNNNV